MPVIEGKKCHRFDGLGDLLKYLNCLLQKKHFIEVTNLTLSYKFLGRTISINLIFPFLLKFPLKGVCFIVFRVLHTRLYYATY